MDHSIKVWSLSDVYLILIKEINEHINIVNKVILLSKERFASSSNDQTVKIWKDNNTYERISILKHDGNFTFFLQ